MLDSRLSRTTSARKVSLNFAPCLHPLRTLFKLLVVFSAAIANSALVPSGKPISHQFAKELLVGFAAAEVDKLAETKGEDWFDKERAKHEAKKNAEHMVRNPRAAPLQTVI